MMFNRNDGHQSFLRGHQGPITCLASSQDNSTIATCDAGSKSQVIIWSTKSCAPLRIIKSPHRYGTDAMNMTGDGKYLVTIGIEDKESQTQEVYDGPMKLAHHYCLDVCIPGNTLEVRTWF